MVRGDASPVRTSNAKNPHGTSSNTPRLDPGCQPVATTSRPSRRRFPNRTAKESTVARRLAAPTLPNRSGRSSVDRDVPFSRTTTEAGPLHLPAELRLPPEIQAPSGPRARTASPLKGGTGVRGVFPGKRTAVT